MIEIKDCDTSYETLMLRDEFSTDTKERAKLADVLILPDFDIKEDVDRAFQPDTINFYKYAKSTAKNYNIELFENRGEEKILSLHSFDIWLPTIYIVSNILLPFIINISSTYVSDMMKGRESDEATVHFHLIIEDKNKNKSKSLFYKGPHSSFKENFEKIDINSLWEE